MRGRGTPVPFDPPTRLVTTGIYAYIANPIQTSAALVLIALGVLLHSWQIAAASMVTVIYGVGFANWIEARDLHARFGDNWLRYRRHVRNWRVRWRPYTEGAATLYVAFTCGKCSEVGRWVQRQQPRGLRIVPAEHHPTRDLWRITYVAADGRHEEDGIAALARALEHMHLGWAWAGMLLRIPLIRPCVQLIVDASGGGPQRIKRVCVSQSS